MNLYDKIRDAECEMPESFCMTIGQVLELIDNSPSEDDLVWTAFKFGYMQRCRAETERKVRRNGSGVISVKWSAGSGARSVFSGYMQ